MKGKIPLAMAAALATLLGLSASFSVAGRKMVEKEIYIPGTGQVYRVKAAPEKIDQTIYYGGDIVTMDGDKPEYVEAVVEKNGRIVFVGRKADAFAQFKKNSFEVDLEGKTMFPGFLDPHGHFMSAVMMVNQVNVAAPPVGTATTIPQIIEKLNIIFSEKQNRRNQ